MNKQTEQANLFNQVLAVAMKEGKLQFSKDADSFQSEIVGEKYLLFSKHRKLILSIPLEQLKRNTRKIRNTGEESNGCLRYLGWSVFGIVFLILFIIPTLEKGGVFDQNAKIRARTAAAKTILATIKKECAAKIAAKGTGTFIVPNELPGYRSSKKNSTGFYLGKDRKIIGTRIVCPTTGEIKLASEDERRYPTFSYNVGTDVKTCIAESGSNAEKRDCVNGAW